MNKFMDFLFHDFQGTHVLVGIILVSLVPLLIIIYLFDL